MSRADPSFLPHPRTNPEHDKLSSLTYPPSELSCKDQPVGHPIPILVITKGGAVTE